MMNLESTIPANLQCSGTAEPAVLAYRRIDRLDIARLGAGNWSIRPGDDTGSFLTLYVMHGTVSVLHADAVTTVAEGEFLLLRAAAMVEVRVDAADVVLTRTPERAAGTHVETLKNACGTRFPTLHGTANLVAHLLRALVEQSRDYRTEHPGRLAQHIVGLLALMCIDGREEDAPSRSSMLQDAIDFIEEHLADLELTPDAIAAAQNMSTRTLHRLFEREGLTISGWIRTRRLEHCRQDLADPRLADVSVSSIGSRWALWDAAHFSRLFKSAFGVSPRVYRAEAFASSRGPKGESLLLQSA
jgi:AraC-like DNA-binding protein